MNLEKACLSLLHTVSTRPCAWHLQKTPSRCLGGIFLYIKFPKMFLFCDAFRVICEKFFFFVRLVDIYRISNHYTQY